MPMMMVKIPTSVTDREREGSEGHRTARTRSDSAGEEREQQHESDHAFGRCRFCVLVPMDQHAGINKRSGAERGCLQRQSPANDRHHATSLRQVTNHPSTTIPGASNHSDAFP
jgi:hypothetical protein